MLKTTLLAAFAAISVSAMAQDTWTGERTANIDANGKTRFEIKREVCRQTEFLSGGDTYDFQEALDRMNGNTEDAIVSGLFAAHRQSVLIHEQVIATMIPADNEFAYTPDQTVLAEETDGSMRPMRMVMEQKPLHRDINYNDALDILCADLSSTQTTYVCNWWNDVKNEHAKDIVVRMLKNDAKIADEPIYVSCYTHHRYDITPIP